MKKLLMILAGGGFPQIETSLGCLSAIFNMKLFDIMSPETYWRGTSAGGIVSTIISMGYTPDDLINAVVKTKTSDLVYRKWFYPIRFLVGNSMYNRKGLEDFICSFTGNKESSNTKVMLTRCKDYQLVEMNGNLENCLGTSSIDGIFPKTNIEGLNYIDGGYTKNCPWYPLMLTEYEKIIIILPPNNPNMIAKVDPIGKLLQELDVKISQEINDTERIFIQNNLYPSVILLRPPPCETDLLSWSKGFSLIQHAYNYTINKIKALSND